MKLTPTTFYAAFFDGLVLMSGHEFNAAGRTWVVHKHRPPYDEWERGYTISDKETGFGMLNKGMPEIRNRRAAVTWAIGQLERFNDKEIDRVIKKARAFRAGLKVIDPPK